MTAFEALAKEELEKLALGLLAARPDWTATLARCEETFQARPVWKWLDGKPAANDVPVIAATLIQTALHDFIRGVAVSAFARLVEENAVSRANEGSLVKRCADLDAERAALLRRVEEERERCAVAAEEAAGFEPDPDWVAKCPMEGEHALGMWRQAHQIAEQIRGLK